MKIKASGMVPDSNKVAVKLGAVRNSGGEDRVRDWEKGLVLRAIKRDESAFAQLYERFADKIFKYTFYKIGNRIEAEDLTGQVFLKAWEAIGSYRYTERPFAAWLYRIAHNLIVDHFRTHRDFAQLDELAVIEHPGVDPVEIAETHLTSDMLRRALKRLTPDQQQVIVLRFLEGYDTTEVAKIMGKQPGAIRTLQHRALAGLNAVLRHSGDQVQDLMPSRHARVGASRMPASQRLAQPVQL